MKAIRIDRRGGVEALQLLELEPPALREGEVLIRVAAAGVNYADVMQREGTYPVPTKLPLVLGLEVAGTIEEPGSSRFARGDKVAAFVRGGYAELAVAKEASVVPLPEGLSFVEATALLVQGATAQLLLEAVRFEPGQSVLVHAAAGGVGVLAVQLAKAAGAFVIAAASTEQKRALATRLGANACVDYGQESWTEQVKQLTGGKGANVILEMTGGKIGQQSYECLAPFGKMAVFGIASGQSVPVDPMRLVFKNQSVIGVAITGYSPPQLSQASQKLMKLHAEGRLEVILGGAFPLAEAAKAHQALAERRTIGKLALVTS